MSSLQPWSIVPPPRAPKAEPPLTISRRFAEQIRASVGAPTIATAPSSDARLRRSKERHGILRRGAIPSDTPAAPRRNRRVTMFKTFSAVAALVVASALVVPTSVSSAAVPVMVQFGPALTTLLTIPWANAGPAMSPAVATETKSARSFTPTSRVSAEPRKLCFGRKNRKSLRTASDVSSSSHGTSIWSEVALRSESREAGSSWQGLSRLRFRRGAHAWDMLRGSISARKRLRERGRET